MSDPTETAQPAEHGLDPELEALREITAAIARHADTLSVASRHYLLDFAASKLTRLPFTRLANFDVLKRNS